MNMSMYKPISLNHTEGTRGRQVKNEKMMSKKRSVGLGNYDMNMSMDKPMELNRTEGTRGTQAKNAEMRS